MSDYGDLQNNIANIRNPENYLFNKIAKERHAEKPAVPPARPNEPAPPLNTKQTIAAGLQKANAAAQTFHWGGPAGGVGHQPGRRSDGGGFGRRGRARRREVAAICQRQGRRSRTFPGGHAARIGAGHSARARQTPPERSSARSAD